MEHHARHKIIWNILRFFLSPFLKIKFNYRYELSRVPGPVLVMANHDTDWDPLLLGVAFPEQMYFVASEHIFRWGWLSKLIRWLLDPISRMKGTTAGDTAMTMLRRLKRGANVAMFANGSRSFNGRSEDILPSTGKLVRISGATLVTYRIDGGYFTQPRWSGKGLRRGKMTGRVVNVYPPEVLKKMSVDQINAAINTDLTVDAYAVQREQMVPFKGKRLAEKLETVLCMCPRCGGLGTMKSEDDRFACSCGYRVRYNAYGFFEGGDLVYDNVTDWDEWQIGRLTALADAAEENQLLLSDQGFELFTILPDHSSIRLGSGGLALYPDRVECCGHSFALTELQGFALHGPTAVNFTVGDDHYELKPQNSVCTRKYQKIIYHLTAKDTIMQS